MTVYFPIDIIKQITANGKKNIFCIVKDIQKILEVE